MHQLDAGDRSTTAPSPQKDDKTTSMRHIAVYVRILTAANTSAAIVAISATPSITTSFVSVLRCSSGNIVRKCTPISAPPKTLAKAMQATSIELRVYLPRAVLGFTSFDSSFAFEANPICLNSARS